MCREKQFPFAGLQFGIECYCGNGPTKGFNWAWPDKCEHRCAGNRNQICGGSYAMSLYSSQSLYSPYSTPKPHYDQLCIYAFPSPRRVLSDLSITGEKNMTIQNCKQLCKGW